METREDSGKLFFLALVKLLATLCQLALTEICGALDGLKRLVNELERQL